MSVAVLREVRLYGPLRARFGRSHWLAVDSPAEAVRALCALFKGFREALAGHKGPGYRVLVGEGARTTARDEYSMAVTAGAARVLRIAPVLHGAKRAGVLGIVVGVALMIFAPYIAGALYSAGMSVGATGAFLTGASTLSTAMILGGVIQLLSPQRVGRGAEAQREASYNFNGPVNINSTGGPVPLIIGRMLVGSVTASTGMSTDDITLPPAPAGGVNPGLPPFEPVNWLDTGGV